MKVYRPKRRRLSTHTSLSQSGTGIFCFVIAAHTFSQLFLRRQWSDRASSIVLIVAWALDFLELGLECFILAKPKEKGPYFGIAGYWCWITPAYPIERFATSYLIMFVSAACSFILYLLVFLRLRGNISVSTLYKIEFHRRPKVRLGRTSDGTYIVTDDQRVESHLTKVAKHMLWYPLVYTVLVLPQAASRFSGFSGASVPFSVTISTAVLFLLHGFFNTLLFCTTRNILPGSWRQRFGLSTMGDSRRCDAEWSSRNSTWRFTGISAKTGTISTGTAHVTLSMGVSKDVEIKYEAQPSPSYLKFSSLSPPATPTSPTSPTPLLQTHAGGGQRAGSHKHNIRPLSFPAPRGARMSIRIKVDGDDDDSSLGAGVDMASEVKIIELEEPLQPQGRATIRSESGISVLALGLEAPASTRLFTTSRLAGNNDERQTHSSSTSTSVTSIDLAPRASGEL